MPLPAADMENGAADSPAAQVETGASPGTSPVIKTKGRGLRRWRRIPREQHKEGSAAAGGAADEDSAQLHKRRIPLPAGAPRGKLHEVVLEEEEEESSTASVESRFVPPAKLDPSLGMLVASSGFSVGAGGADSDNSEDRSSGSRSSTAASAPRRHDSSPFAARDRAPRSSLHGKISHLAARARAVAAAEAENSRSGVESDLRTSHAVSSRRSGANAAGNGIHNHKENGSVVGRLAQGSVDSDADAAERSVGNNGGIGSRMQSSADSYAEPILLLQRTQEALENEIKMFAVISKESSDDLDGCDDDWSGSVQLKEPWSAVPGEDRSRDSEHHPDKSCSNLGTPSR